MTDELIPFDEWQPDGTSESYIIQSIIFESQKDYPAALDCLESALELDPSNGCIYINRAKIYGKIGRIADALVDFDRAKELAADKHPVHSKALIHYEKNFFFQKLKRFPEALKETNAILELDPDSEVIYTVRGDIYRQMGRISEALADYDKSIELNPARSGSYSQKSLLLNDLGFPDKALKELNMAIGWDPENPCLYIDRAKFYKTTELAEKARADCDKVMELVMKNHDPDNDLDCEYLEIIRKEVDEIRS